MWLWDWERVGISRVRSVIYLKSVFRFLFNKVNRRLRKNTNTRREISVKPKLQDTLTNSATSFINNSFDGLQYELRIRTAKFITEVLDANYIAILRFHKSNHSINLYSYVKRDNYIYCLLSIFIIFFVSFF